jgi:hypothetical protein
MVKDEVMAFVQGPCTICGKDTEALPHYDGSLTCSLACSRIWFDRVIEKDGVAWSSTLQQVKSMLSSMRSKDNDMPPD